MIPAAAFSGSPIAVAAGAQHSLVLTDSGSVHACGSNEFGKCTHRNTAATTVQSMRTVTITATAIAKIFCRNLLPHN
jgi:alpha-tubulin suppressor-like RCC1 family protein